MARQKVTNEEFPHYCLIKRVSDVTSFSDGEETIIYQGACRRESSANIRTFKQGTSSVGQVVYGDFRVSIPGIEKIIQGDIVDVDFGIGQDSGGVISHPNPSALKTPRYPNGRTEFYYSLPEQ